MTKIDVLQDSDEQESIEEGRPVQVRRKYKLFMIMHFMTDVPKHNKYFVGLSRIRAPDKRHSRQ